MTAQGGEGDEAANVTDTPNSALGLEEEAEDLGAPEDHEGGSGFASSNRGSTSAPALGPAAEEFFLNRSLDGPGFDEEQHLEHLVLCEAVEAGGRKQGQARRARCGVVQHDGARKGDHDDKEQKPHGSLHRKSVTSHTSRHRQIEKKHIHRSGRHRGQESQKNRNRKTGPAQ